MMASWRPLAVAVALNVVVGIGVAAAQTVIVRNAPAGATIELALNAKTIDSATAGKNGQVTFTPNLSAATGAKESDVRVYADACGNVRRVVLVERPAQTPVPAPGCVRRESVGFFLVRPVTTLVVDIAEANLSVWLRQGPVPPEWLTQEAGASSVSSVSRPAPTGLALFGGGSFQKFRDFEGIECGTAESCSGKAFRAGYTAGAVFWINRFIGAEASVLKPARVTVTGAGSNYSFDTVLEPRILTLAANVGPAFGPVRLYGQIGANYHYGKNTTTTTIQNVTITAEDGTTTVIPGGTQTTTTETAGWGYLFGAGFEGWVAPSFALYAEGGRLQFKGTSLHGGEAKVNDRVTYILFGARIRIGRRQ